MREKVWSNFLNRFVVIGGPDWEAHLAAQQAVLDPELANPDSPLRQYLAKQAEAEKKGLSVARYGQQLRDQAAREATARAWHQKACEAGYVTDSEGSLYLPDPPSAWPPPLRKDGLEVKMRKLDPKTAIITGYLSTFGNVDHAGDIAQPHCFDRTLAAKRGKAILMPVLWCHKLDMPLGGVTEAKTDGHGLYVACLIDLETRAGKEAYSAVAKHYSASLSMGYRTVRDSYDTQGHRLLEDVELMEASIVPLPANDQARVLSARVVTEEGD